MTSGGNNFNYFPENQLTKFKLAPPPNFLIFAPMDFCNALCITGVPLDAHAEHIQGYFTESRYINLLTYLITPSLNVHCLE